MEGCWRVHFGVPIINIDPPQSSAGQSASQPIRPSVQAERQRIKLVGDIQMSRALQKVECTQMQKVIRCYVLN